MPFHSRPRRFQTPKTPVMVRPQGSFVWLKGAVLNLSASGLMLHTLVSLDNQTKLEMEITSTDKLGKKTLRKLKGQIVWKKNQLYGVKFLKA